MPMNMVVLGEEAVQECPGLDQTAERAGEVVQVFQGLELRLGVGLSLETRGREWVTPRSTSNAGTRLDVIEVPRSACTVCGADPFRAIASSMKSFASTESSAAATTHPGAMPRSVS